jgi:hypothetical protein
MLKWKYWHERDDWSGPRSYLLERGGKVVGHVGLWPVCFQAESNEIQRGIQMIDWAAAKDAPGTGIALVQRLAKTFDFIYSIGGSEMTQKILPAFGFREYAKTWNGARPLRPVPQIASHPARNWKLFPRLVRNGFWALYPPLVTQGWRADPISPEDFPKELLTLRSPQKCSFARERGFFEYLLSCPGARFQLYSVCDPNGPKGFVLISLIRRQARVAGIWLDSPDREAWKHCFTLSQEAAALFPEACEVVVRGTRSTSSDAAAASGFRLHSGPSVYLLDRKGKFPRDFDFQMTDDDLCFLDDGTVSYWT